MSLFYLMFFVPINATTSPMFKRILSALRGKKNSAHAAVSEHANEAEPAAANDEPIVAYDAYGREMHITRDEWHDKIFLPTLQQK